MMPVTSHIYERKTNDTYHTEQDDTMRRLLDIEKQVTALSRAEKWQLINDVQEMLRQEEVSVLPHLPQPGRTYPLFTPVGLEEGAAKLEEYLQEGKL